MISIIPSVSDSIVGINITPRTITCSWIEHTPSKTMPYELKAYKHLLFEVHQKNSLIVFNPTRLRTLITTFLRLHSLQDAYVVIALSGHDLIEKQVMLSKPTADLQPLEQAENLVWYYYCLQENAQGTMSPWYCCAMPYELLFQYQLLSMMCQLNVVQITTPTMALVEAYRYIKKKRAVNSKTNITEFISLNGQLRIKSHQEHAALVESFGLFLLGKNVYEEH